MLAASNQFYADALVAHMENPNLPNPFDQLDDLKSINDMKKKFVRDIMDKPELEEAIKRLDGLSEKRLKNVLAIVNAIIDSYESGKDLHMIINIESRPVE